MVRRVTEGSVGAFAWGSFPLAAKAIAERPLLVGAVVIAMAFMDWQVGGGGAAPLSGEWLARAVLGGLLDAALTTPLMVAVHRFVILEQRGPAGAGRALLGVYRQYFGWLVAFQVLGAPLVALQAMMPVPGPTGAVVVTSGTLVALGAALVLLVPLMWVVIRTSMLLPAVAVAAPGATLRAAWSDGAGHVWPMLWSIVLACVGMVLAIMAVEFLVAASAPQASLGGGLPTALIGAIGSVLLTALGTAVTSQFYLVWGRALRGTVRE